MRPDAPAPRGERAARGEELAPGERLGSRAQLTGTNGRPASPSAERARRLLSGSRLAFEQDVRLRPRGDAYERTHRGHRAARTDEPGDGLVAQRGRSRLASERAHGLDEVLRARDRVVGGAGLHDRDRERRPILAADGEERHRAARAAHRVDRRDHVRARHARRREHDEIGRRERVVDLGRAHRDHVRPGSHGRQPAGEWVAFLHSDHDDPHPRALPRARVERSRPGAITSVEVSDSPSDPTRSLGSAS